MAHPNSDQEKEMANRIMLEDSIALSMLREVSQNSAIKEVVASAGLTLIDRVLDPIMRVVATLDNIQDLDRIEHQEIKKSILALVDQHAAEGVQYGGIMKDTKKNEILKDLDTVKEFLERVKSEIEYENILQIAPNDLDAIARVTKVMCDLSFCYVECLKSLHTENFTNIANMIRPSAEELDIRIPRKEAMLAESFGISTSKPGDLSLKNLGTGRAAGKAAFSDVAMYKRLELLRNVVNDKVKHGNIDHLTGNDRNVFLSNVLKLHYYKMPDIDTEMLANPDADRLEILSAIEHFNQLCALVSRTKPDDPTLPQAQDNLIQAMSHLTELGLMNDTALAEYAQKQQTTFEKLAQMTYGNLPLVASASGTTGRLLVALQDMQCFYSHSTGEFNFNQAQIMANCLLGSIMHGGHHSFLEVAEIYNRLIDIAALEMAEKKPEELKAIGGEQGLPYYHIGDYASFFSPTYRPQVIDRAREDLANKEAPSDISPKNG